eukprot:CAMPEP_0177795112 /NCGR_PEP_ID=MMETSP0491_2-20121128/26036_1 /TAXON_ID=63592 /ORGANISM="Tetraselmis chuii, Strain PLY429" /LENGTH=110 /DNA_ID=CAMNT_0019317875 /DNA_START=19 /DNA_END=351 /DNA_ORIENTATION=-
MAGYEYSQPLRHPPLWKWFCKSRTTGHVFPSSVLNAMLMGCFRPQELEFVNISTSAPEGSSAAMTALLLLGRPPRDNRSRRKARILPPGKRTTAGCTRPCPGDEILAVLA